MRAAKPDDWNAYLLHGNTSEATYKLLEIQQQHKEFDLEMHLLA